MRYLLLLALLMFAAPAKAEERFLGILELPALCALPCAGSDQPVPLYTAPYQEEPALEISRALFFEDDPDVQDQRHPLWPETLEFARDTHGAIVYEMIPGTAWKIHIGETGYWIKTGGAAEFHPYPQMLKDKLAYLRYWDFTLWTLPGEQPRILAHPYQHDPVLAAQIPVRILSTRIVDGQWWLQVTIFVRTPCADPDQPLFAKGWVPAYLPDGRRTAWYDPDGC